MNAIVAQQQNYLDVPFSKLNELAARLRAAGARISVTRFGNLHRIILLQQPTFASVDQILSYVNSSEQNQVIAQTEAVKISSPIIVSDNSVTSVDNTILNTNKSELKVVSLDEVSIEQLKKLASNHKLPGRSKMNACQLREKLQGLVTQEQLSSL